MDKKKYNEALKRPLRRFALKDKCEIPEIGSHKEDLPDYLKAGLAWNVFGKWVVADGESDQNAVRIGSDGTLKSGHVCIVLRGLGFTFYFYEIIDDYSKEQYDIFDYIRLVLDKILVTNQASSYKLRWYLQRYENWTGSIFPKFFNIYDQKKIAKWSEQIDDEIEENSNKKFILKKRDRKKYWNLITSDHQNIFDIKGCYGELLSIFNTIKPILPQDNIAIIEELILRCEHGYFLGFLLDKTFQEYSKKYPDVIPEERSKEYLLKRLQDFRKGREERVYAASKEAFELNDHLKEKLRRMFSVMEVK